MLVTTKTVNSCSQIEMKDADNQEVVLTRNPETGNYAFKSLLLGDDEWVHSSREFDIQTAIIEAYVLFGIITD